MAVRTVQYAIKVSAKAYSCNLCTHSDAYERDAIRYATYATLRYSLRYIRYAKRDAKDAEYCWFHLTSNERERETWAWSVSVKREREA